MSSCIFENENIFFWMLPSHHVVQSDLEMQKKSGLCVTGVLSATFEKISLNLAR